jgi:MATE family multidrug resistance protein
MATNITYIANMLLTQLLVSRSSDFSRTRVPFDKTAFQHWKAYLKIGIPGAFMLCFEWWAFELLAIFSGYMGIAPLAAEVIIINLVGFVFMLPLGVATAASALTGNYIGSRKIGLAKKFANMSLLFGTLQIIAVIALIVLFKDSICSFFTRDEEVVDVI